MMRNALFVGAGGALGAVLRSSISLWIPVSMPIPTLLANIVGSFLLGYATILVQKEKLSPERMLLLGTGFCGGLTTISTFSMETVHLWQQFAPYAYLYIILTGLMGLGAALFGMKIARGKWSGADR
ncbi:MAG: fluoride efflux transporter FluC [Bacillus sp. (in: firmicutes)]